MSSVRRTPHLSPLRRSWRMARLRAHHRVARATKLFTHCWVRRPGRAARSGPGHRISRICHISIWPRGQFASFERRCISSSPMRSCGGPVESGSWWRCLYTYPSSVHAQSELCGARFSIRIKRTLGQHSVPPLVFKCIHARLDKVELGLLRRVLREGTRRPSIATIGRDVSVACGGPLGSV